MAFDILGREVTVRPLPAPDPAPAQRLGELLAHRRRSGLPWPNEAEYNRMTALAVAFVSSPTERVDWRTVLAEQRDDVWKAAYERELLVRRPLAVG